MNREEYLEAHFEENEYEFGVTTALRLRLLANTAHVFPRVHLVSLSAEVLRLNATSASFGIAFTTTDSDSISKTRIASRSSTPRMTSMASPSPWPLSPMMFSRSSTIS
jgi:hypothetical protein